MGQVIFFAVVVLAAVSALSYLGNLGIGSSGGVGTAPPAQNTGGFMNIATFIAKSESFSAYVYNDPPGSDKYSIGYGHQVREGDPYFPFTSFRGPISLDEAKNLLIQDTLSAQLCVEQSVTVAINDNQKTALTSLCYNIGCNAFSSSTLVRFLNDGQYQLAADEFLRWVYSGGQKSDGLALRRSQERSLFLS
jgi:lysozyme